MKQTRLESLIEAVINIGSGFFISLAVWVLVVIPVWHLPITMLDNLAITGLYTAVSITRSYIWRRFFNAGLHRSAHRWARMLTRTTIRSQ